MAALLTFSPFHVFYSQDARMYTHASFSYVDGTIIFFNGN